MNDKHLSFVVASQSQNMLILMCFITNHLCSIKGGGVGGGGGGVHPKFKNN